MLSSQWWEDSKESTKKKMEENWNGKSNGQCKCTGSEPNSIMRFGLKGVGHDTRNTNRYCRFGEIEITLLLLRFDVRPFAFALCSSECSHISLRMCTIERLTLTHTHSSRLNAITYFAFFKQLYFLYQCHLHSTIQHIQYSLSILLFFMHNKIYSGGFRCGDTFKFSYKSSS